MRQNLIRRYKEGLISLSFAIIASIILFIAAFAKMAYTTGAITDFFLGVALFEIALAFAFLIFHHQHEIWGMGALVFALWAGYASFWLLYGLPCACFGQMLNLPPLASISIDGVLYAGSLFLARYLGATRSLIRHILWFSIFAVIIGFLVAYVINYLISG